MSGAARNAANPTYRSWKAMRVRCRNPNVACYPRYGGRGISVCERWDSYEMFVRDMGERPAGATLERVDNERGYSPDNCRWATYKEQARNTRRNRLSMEDADAIRSMRQTTSLTQQQIAEAFGTTQATVSAILRGKLWAA